MSEFTECGSYLLDSRLSEELDSALVLALRGLSCGIAASETEARAQTGKKKAASVDSVSLSGLRV